jgi:hypothetical protein
MIVGALFAQADSALCAKSKHADGRVKVENLIVSI